MGGILKLTSLLEGERRGILFLGPRNDSLSQMAEGFARFLCPADLTVYSAGCQPCAVAQLTVRTMKEVGIDVSAYKSKGLDGVPLERIAIAITLCEPEEPMPNLPERIQVLEWPISDPCKDGGTGGEENLAAFRASRDKVRELVSALF
jgi:arsenate reductase